MFRCNLLATTCSVFKGNSTTHPTQVCGFTVCGTSALSISLCGCTGNIMIYLYDSIGNLLYANSYECLTCSALVYYPASYYSGDANQCAAYTMSQGCFFNSGACSGAAVVSVTTGQITSYAFDTGNDANRIDPMFVNNLALPLQKFEHQDNRKKRNQAMDSKMEEQQREKEQKYILEKIFKNEIEDGDGGSQFKQDIVEDVELN